MKSHRYQVLFFFVLIVSLFSCNKSFLEQKYNSNQNIPTTLEDVTAILNRISYSVNSSRELGILGADEYYVLPHRYDIASRIYMKNAYIWADEVYEGFDTPDWVWAYERILYANLALDVLEKMEVQSSTHQHLKGVALFHRSYNYYLLAQLFCRPYGQVPDDNLGLPLRLEVDVSSLVGRSTLKETYLQIISDLEQAEQLILTDFSGTMEVSRSQIYAVLSRIYQHIGDFSKVVHYSDLCLAIKSELIDFNLLDKDKRDSFMQDYGISNPEVIWMEDLVGVQFLSRSSSLNVDSSLYFSYSKYDLRLPLYFHTENDGRITFKGSYTGGSSFFVGMAVDEIYLNKAEAHTRLEQLQEAKASLSFFLRHRYMLDEWPPYESMDRNQLLRLILDERRKELVFRGLRWEDLRRLNTDPETETMIRRQLGSQQYTLLPGDPKYTWPIPLKEIAYGKIEQNER